MNIATEICGKIIFGSWLLLLQQQSINQSILELEEF